MQVTESERIENPNGKRLEIYKNSWCRLTFAQISYGGDVFCSAVA